MGTPLFARHRLQLPFCLATQQPCCCPPAFQVAEAGDVMNTTLALARELGMEASELVCGLGWLEVARL